MRSVSGNQSSGEAHPFDVTLGRIEMGPAAAASMLTAMFRLTLVVGSGSFGSRGWRGVRCGGRMEGKRGKVELIDGRQWRRCCGQIRWGRWSSSEPVRTGGLGGEGDGAARTSRVKRAKKILKGGSGSTLLSGGERKRGG
jgi:hypothetical protein